MPHYKTVPPKHWERARILRMQPTPAERLLWRALRTRIRNIRFRRQHPIGPYIVDFVCLSKKLIIELDGSGHTEENQKEYDRLRTCYIESRGFQIKRYFNNAVLENVEGVLADILNTLVK